MSKTLEFIYRHRFDGLDKLDADWPHHVDGLTQPFVLVHGMHSHEFTVAFFCVPRNNNHTQVKSLAFFLVGRDAGPEFESTFLFLNRRTDQTISRQSDSCTQSPEDGRRRFHCVQFLLDDQAAAAADGRPGPLQALKSQGLLVDEEEPSLQIHIRLKFDADAFGRQSLLSEASARLPDFPTMARCPERQFPLAMFDLVDKPPEAWTSANFVLVSSDGVQFRVHAEVLKPFVFFQNKLWQTFFDRPLEDELVEQQQRCMAFDDINGAVLREILRYCYLRCAPLTLGSSVLELVRAADYLGIEPLVDACQLSILELLADNKLSVARLVELLLECDRYRLLECRQACLCRLLPVWHSLLMQHQQLYRAIVDYARSNIDTDHDLLQVACSFMARNANVQCVGCLDQAIERGTGHTLST